MRSIRTAHVRKGIRGALFAASALALCLPLAACGAAGTGATSGDTTDPTPTASADATVPEACSLLSPDLIEAATGVAGAKGKLNKDLSIPGTSVCEWKGSKADLPSVQVLITTLAGEPEATPGVTPTPAPSPDPSASADPNSVAAHRASAEAASGVATDVVVAGGDDAFILGNGSVVGMGIKTLKHLYYIQVTYTSGDSTDVSGITKALAALVATYF